MNGKYGKSQLLNFAKDSYLERTSRPIYAIFFLLPFVAFYELGTIFINTNVLRHYWQGRVVAFAWLQRSLEYLGLGSKLAWVATPLAVGIILLALHIASRKPWWFRPRDVGPMLVECILLAVPLIVLSLFLSSPVGVEQGLDPSADLLQEQTASAGRSPAAVSVLANSGNTQSEGGPAVKLLADIVTGIGAGIYEELVFRLILICLLMLAFQDVLRLSQRNAAILAVLVSAALFSAYHHIDFISGRLYQTVPFHWTEFVFRTIAGVYFAGLFAVRGFAITAGTHAFYDVIATVINAVFFGGQN
jgi:membrane protease YdiL (CAAX protease family)